MDPREGSTGLQFVFVVGMSTFVWVGKNSSPTRVGLSADIHSLAGGGLLVGSRVSITGFALF